MPISVPPGVVFAYNGWTFGPYTKTRVTEEPVTSGDNRVVKYSKITIHVTGWLSSLDFTAQATTLDAIMQIMRRALQRHGKRLQYVNKGYGVDIDVNNPSGTVWDVNLGPKAGTLTWWPLGGLPNGSNAAGFEWEVTTWLPECSNAVYVANEEVFSEISFNVSFETGEDGLLTRTVNGTAQIPLSLNAAGGIDVDVDFWLSSIIKPPAPGYLRRMNRQISPDRSTATFTITDKQIEVAYPDNVVAIQAEHRLRATNLANAIWDATLTATIRLSPTAEPVLAWIQFYKILAGRMAASLAFAAAARADGTARAGITPPVIEMSENLFKLESRFSAHYKILGARLEHIIAASGLWKSVGTDFARWSTTLGAGTYDGNAQSTLGILGARFNTSDDIIIDVCNYATGGSVPAVVGADDDDIASEDLAAAEATAETIALANVYENYEPASLLASAEELAGGNNSKGNFIGPDDGTDGSALIVPPESSWLEYTCTVRRVTDHQVVRHKPLAGTVTYGQIAVDPLGPAAPLETDTTTPTFNVTATVPDVIQQLAAPSVTIQLIGFARRVGFRINPPRLIEFGGQTPVIQQEDVQEGTEGAPGGVIYYWLSWTLTYLVPTPPASIDVPANPVDDLDGTEAPGGQEGG